MQKPPEIPDINDLLLEQMRYRARVIEFYRQPLVDLLNMNPSALEMIVLNAWLLATLLVWNPEIERTLGPEVAAACVLYRDMLNQHLNDNPAMREISGPQYILPTFAEAGEIPARPDPAVMLITPDVNLTPDKKHTVN